MPSESLNPQIPGSCYELVYPGVLFYPPIHNFDHPNNNHINLPAEAREDQIQGHKNLNFAITGHDYDSSSENITLPSQSFSNHVETAAHPRWLPMFTGDRLLQEGTPFESVSQFQITTDILHLESATTHGQSPHTVRRPSCGRLLEDVPTPNYITSDTQACDQLSSSTGRSSPTLVPSLRSSTGTRRSQKRKSSVENYSLPVKLSISQKRDHKMVEKRYRTNLNAKINLLHQAIPSLHRGSGASSVSEDNGDSRPEVIVDYQSRRQKYGKAAVIARAVDYVKYLEENTERLITEAAALQARICAIEKLATRGLKNDTTIDVVAEQGLLVNGDTLYGIQADFQKSESYDSESLIQTQTSKKRRKRI